MQEVLLPRQRAAEPAHYRCADRGVKAGCILLHRPWANLCWCYQNSQWPNLWSLLWLLSSCLLIPLHWSSVTGASLYIEDSEGDLIFHVSRGRSRFTAPVFFPPGFFETCWILRPTEVFPSALKKALLDACMDLNVPVYRFGLLRALWSRAFGRPIPLEKYTASEAKVTGEGFLLACVWKRATALVAERRCLIDEVPVVDIGVQCQRYPTALLPRDLLLLSGPAFRLSR